MWVAYVPKPQLAVKLRALTAGVRLREGQYDKLFYVVKTEQTFIVFGLYLLIFYLLYFVEALVADSPSLPSDAAKQLQSSPNPPALRTVGSCLRMLNLQPHCTGGWLKVYVQVSVQFDSSVVENSQIPPSISLEVELLR